MTPGADRAVAVLDPSPGGHVIAWPEGVGKPEPARVAEARRVAGSGKPALHPQTRKRDDKIFDTLAVPLHSSGQTRGGLVVDMPHRPAATQQAVIQHLLCGAVWLETLRTGSSEGASTAKDVLELLAMTTDTPELKPSLVRFVTELAGRGGLTRVSLGFRLGTRIELHAISHAAEFDRSSDLASAIEQAMEETLSEGEPIRYPGEEAEAGTFPAHASLQKEHAGGVVATFPFGGSDSERSTAVPSGVVLVETAEDSAFTAQTEALCDAAATMIGPVLATRQRESQPALRILRARATEKLRDWLGPNRFVGKATAVGALLFFLLAFLPVPHRVSADAVLEGTVQRAVVAASDGYIGEARARAGDVVEEGELIAALDATELELEKVQWETRRAQTRKEQRQARARREYAEAKILAARLAQADAELAALEVQIERSRLVAPFHGVIVKGDLSRSLGAPVERGEVLFEIAPLDSYRVTLEVDERDVAHVAIGQTGRLALTALPHQQHPFRIERVTPMASAEEGRNFFRVEAGLADDTLGLRPGMEGLAKIEIGRRSLYWVASHRAADWFRLATWGFWL